MTFSYYKDGCDGDLEEEEELEHFSSIARLQQRDKG